MVSVSLLCKIACIVAFTKVFEAHPVTSSSQQSDSRGDILQSHDDESTTQDHPSIEWRTLTPKANTHPINDNFIKVLADSTSPKHSMRYKTPDICDPTVKQISGYLDIEDDKHYFFWFFESRNNPKEDPLILWLNGGPGCTSLEGLFTELGPCFINKEGDGTVYNEHSWNNNASIIFLDQPTNVGYSYGKDGKPYSSEAAKDVYAFLQLFFKEFHDYAALDFHVAGESYAGHYIPAIGGEINRNNKKSTSDDDKEDGSRRMAIKLKSLLVGNGQTDPLTQYKYFSKYACENPYGPVLNQSICNDMDNKYPGCAALIQKCYSSKDPSSCNAATDTCNSDMWDPFFKTGKNPYDIRKDCVDDSCLGLDAGLEKYLNRKDVMLAVGAQVDKVVMCNDDINLRFTSTGDWMLPYVNEIPQLLEDGIRVLIYAGDADFVCNYMGNKAWVIKLPWSGHNEFASAKDTAWFSSTANEQGGELRRTKDGRLAFLRVFNAGHMVPKDQGGYALDMVNSWLHEQLE
ncbi:hypothetical protein O0I10_008671 [Lichtheimia ornata]|uniref:Carboxypeptidase n=1 Tax=Lichtheimia ornata TaxID=688661 RepID=A0AAD7XWJ3_9FUNG|nr:uncharacterized protein O0I10_008671 [Lichtheimia ornata]KAJ8655583.1 hypothetical protein O0I10_008671 [Lichtheimia ornata]